jgi:hypothetical protein
MPRTIFIVVFLVLLCCQVSSAAMSGDFDGDNFVTLKDIAYGLAFYLNSSATTATLPGYADDFYAQATGPVSRLPDGIIDDFNGDAGFGLGDIAVMLAHYLSSSKVFDSVESAANGYFSRTGALYKLPGTPTGDSSFSTTITGIQTD